MARPSPPRGVPPMCFDLDSHPPIAAHRRRGRSTARGRRLTAADGNHPAAFLARAASPAARPSLLLPDVRGLHPFYEELALRFAEHGIDALAIDWFGRTAPDDAPRRGVRVHAARRGHDLGRDRRRHRGRRRVPARSTGAARRPASRPRSSRSASAWAGGCRSWPATLGLGLAGVIGFYGTLVGPWRNDAPAPVDVAASIASPVLGLFGGADGGDHARGHRRLRCGAHVDGHGPSPGQLRGRPAQLLRPQGGRVRGCQRGGVGRDAGVHRRSGGRRLLAPAQTVDDRSDRRADPCGGGRRVDRAWQVDGLLGQADVEHGSQDPWRPRPVHR